MVVDNLELFPSHEKIYSFDSLALCSHVRTLTADLFITRRKNSSFSIFSRGDICFSNLQNNTGLINN